MSIETYRDYIYSKIPDDSATYNKEDPDRMNLNDLILLYETSIKREESLSDDEESNKNLSEFLKKYYVNENDRNLGKFMTIIKFRNNDVVVKEEINNWKDIYDIVDEHKWKVGDKQLYGNLQMWKKIKLECKGRFFLMPKDMDTIYELIIKGITTESKKWFYEQLEAMLGSPPPQPSVKDPEIYYHDHIYKLLYLLDNDIKLYIEGTIFNKNCVVDDDKTKQYRKDYEERDKLITEKLKENKKVYGPRMYSDVVKDFNEKVENSFGYHLIPNEIWNFKDKIDREIAERVKTHITKRNNPYLKYYMLSEKFLGPKIDRKLFFIKPEEKVKFLQNSVELYKKDIMEDEEFVINIPLNKFPLNYIKHVMEKEEIWKDMYEKIETEMNLQLLRPSARTIEGDINEQFQSNLKENVNWKKEERIKLTDKIIGEIVSLESKVRGTESKLGDDEKKLIKKHILGEIQKKVSDQMNRARELEIEQQNEVNPLQQNLGQIQSREKRIQKQKINSGKADPFPKWSTVPKGKKDVNIEKFIWPYEKDEITVIPFTKSLLEDIFKNKNLVPQPASAQEAVKDKLKHNGPKFSRNFSQQIPKLLYTGATIIPDKEKKEKKLQKNDEIINFKNITDILMHSSTYEWKRNKICREFKKIITDKANESEEVYDLAGALTGIPDKFNLVIYRPPEGTGAGDDNGSDGLLLDIKLRF